MSELESRASVARTRSARGSRVVGHGRSGTAVALMLTLLFMTAPTARGQSQGDWPQFLHGPDRSGFNADESILDPESVPTLGQRWEADLGDRADLEPPVVANGLVYVVDVMDAVHAFDAESGTEVWVSDEEFPHPAGSPNTTPAVAGGYVVFGCGGATLCALDAATGTPRWNVILGPFTLHPPAIHDATVVATTNETVAAVNAVTGEMLWEVTVDGTIFAPATVVDGKVYVGATDREDGTRLFALDVSSGTVRWTSGELDGIVYGAAAAVGDVVYVPAGSKAYALAAEDGSKLWETEPKKPYSSVNAVAADGELVFATVASGEIAALDPASGAVVWSTDVGASAYSAPAVANDVLYLGLGGPSSADTGAVVALQSGTGRRLWSRSFVSSAYRSSPAVSNGVVYFTLSDGTLHAYDSGREDPDATASPLLLLHGIDSVGASGENGTSKWADFRSSFAAWGWTGEIRSLAYYGHNTGTYDESVSGHGSHRGHHGGAKEHVGRGENRHDHDTDIRHIAQHWAWYVYDRYARRGVSVDVVAHSMGGLIVRYAIARVGAYDDDFPPQLYVGDVVTLGTPHGGTSLAGLCPRSERTVDQCRQMRRGSPLIEWLNGQGTAPQARGGTDWTAIGSRDDEALSPDETAIDDDLAAHHRVLYDEYSFGNGVQHDDYLHIASDRDDAKVDCHDRGAAAKPSCADDDGDLQSWDGAPWPIRLAYYAVMTDRW